MFLQTHSCRAESSAVWQQFSQEMGCALYDCNKLLNRTELFPDAQAFRDAEHMTRTGTQAYTRVFCELIRSQQNGGIFPKRSIPPIHRCSGRLTDKMFGSSSKKLPVSRLLHPTVAQATYRSYPPGNAARRRMALPEILCLSVPRVPEHRAQRDANRSFSRRLILDGTMFLAVRTR